MRKLKMLIVLFLIVPLMVSAQDIKQIRRGGVNDSKTASRINETITQSNLNVDSLDAQLINFQTGDLNVTDDAVVADALTVGGKVALDSTLMLGTFGDATQTVLSESSSDTNPLIGIYPMVNFEASANKVFAGAHSRILAITESQVNDISMYGMESQCRVKGVDLGNGVYAGMWAYAEQSGATTLSGGGNFLGLSAVVEASTDFAAGATETVAGVLIDNNIHASATLNDDTNYSGLYIKSTGLDWKYGIKITGVDSIDIELQSGAQIDNNQTDTLRLTETNIKVVGNLVVTGSTSDFAITDEQLPFDEYWAKTLELNKLPAFENVDRRNVVDYISGLEESNERLLRYVVVMEARLTELENK